MNLSKRSNTRIRYNDGNDFIQLRHSAREDWANWQKANVNTVPSVITVTTSDYVDEVVSCSIGNESYLKKFENGTITFKVYTEGTVTLSCADKTKSVSVVSGNSYDVVFERESATITITTTNLQGQTVSYSCDGGEVKQFTFPSTGTTQIKVYEFGTYTFTCSETSVSVDVASGGSYTVTMVEFSRVDLMIDGVAQTGVTMVNGSYVSDGYWRVDGSEELKTVCNFDLTESMIGKVLSCITSKLLRSYSFVYTNTSSTAVNVNFTREAFDTDYYRYYLTIPEDADIDNVGNIQIRFSESELSKIYDIYIE